MSVNDWPDALLPLTWPVTTRLAPAAAESTFAVFGRASVLPIVSLPSATATPPADVAVLIVNEPGPTFSIDPAPEIVPLNVPPSGWLKRTVLRLVIGPENEPDVPSPISSVPAETMLVAERKLGPVSVSVLGPALMNGWLPSSVSSWPS